MTQLLASHHREDDASEMVDATTYDRVTVLYERLRNGIRPIVLRQVGQSPPTYQLYRLNEHGAYCNDRDCDRRDARLLIQSIRSSDDFIGSKQGTPADLWPGEPHDKHPSWSGGDDW